MSSPGKSLGTTEDAQSSYGQIVRSSSIMGGVAAITLILGMVRTKFAAVLVGTTGAGLLANFLALQGMLTTLSGLGIASSAVRDVARAYAATDEAGIGRAVLTLRRVCWLTGLLGALVTCVLSPWLSRLTFGTGDFTWHVAALGLCVLLANLQGGQTALIQGSRRIGQLARVQVSAAVGGTAVSVAMYFWLGIDGLVPALVLLAAVNCAISWRFAREVPVPKVHMTFRESFRQAGTMARLGVAMMWNALIGSATVYAINSLITHKLGVQALGIYSAANALSGTFVNFVLGAMVADYYPRLASVADDNSALNRLVNEQTEVGLLLAIPGLVATLTLARWAIHVLYSSEFLPAAVLLEWFAIGCLGRVVGWPLGYLLMAKSRGGWMVACETAAQVVQLVLIWFGVRQFGLAGTALAFVLLYIFYTAMVFAVARHLTGFGWSRHCRAQIGLALAMMVVGWMVAQIHSPLVSAPIAIACVAAATAHTARGLAERLGCDHPFTRAILRVPLLAKLAPRRCI